MCVCVSHMCVVLNILYIYTERAPLSFACFFAGNCVEEEIAVMRQYQMTPTVTSEAFLKQWALWPAPVQVSSLIPWLDTCIGTLFGFSTLMCHIMVKYRKSITSFVASKTQGFRQVLVMSHWHTSKIWNDQIVRFQVCRMIIGKLLMCQPGLMGATHLLIESKNDQLLYSLWWIGQVAYYVLGLAQALKAICDFVGCKGMEVMLFTPYFKLKVFQYFK